MATGAGEGDMAIGDGAEAMAIGIGLVACAIWGVGLAEAGVIIATVFGAGAGLVSITLGLDGFCDARPTPISIRFESSSSSGHG